MRTLGFRSNVLFVIASSMGLLAALGRHWYAPGLAPTTIEGDPLVGEVQGPVEGFFSRLAREFTATDGTTGWHVFTTTDLVICGLVAVIVVTALAVMVPALQAVASEVLRFAALALLGIVAAKIANVPDDMGLAERRQGAWIALGVTGIAVSSAFSLCAAPARRRRVGRSLYDSPAPAPPMSTIDSAGSTAPPAI
jgi:hypothetical protein